MKEWADKYKGKFDDGWDNIASDNFAVPKPWPGFRRMHSYAAPRPMASWDSIPEAENLFSAD